MASLHVASGWLARPEGLKILAENHTLSISPQYGLSEPSEFQILSANRQCQSVLIHRCDREIRLAFQVDVKRRGAHSENERKEQVGFRDLGGLL